MHKLLFLLIVSWLAMLPASLSIAEDPATDPMVAPADDQGSDLEFAPATSGPDQIVEIDVNGEARKVQYDLTPNDEAVVQGDIILGPAQEIEAIREGEEAASLESVGLEGLFKRGTGYLWPKGVLRYAFGAGFSSKNMVQAAIAHWEAKTRIRFEQANSGNYVLFVNAGECSSSVGMQGSVQRINLSPQCG